MREFKTAQEIVDYMEANFAQYGVRGASERDEQANYNEGDFMGFSLDLCDERDCEYDEDAEELDGTCAIGINQMMYDDDVAKAVEMARGYAGNHHCTNIVYLICGKDSEYGADEQEVIINNSDITGYRGAQVVGVVGF